VLRHLRQHGCALLREGQRHSVLWNPATHQTSAVARHTEIADTLVRKICRDLGILAP